MESSEQGMCRSRDSFYAIAIIILASSQPFVSFLNDNRGQVQQPARVVVYSAVVAALGLIVWALVAQVVGVHRSRAVAVGVAVALMSFFGYSLWLDPTPAPGRKTISLMIWALMTVTVVWLAVRLSHYPGFRTGLLVVLISLVAVPTASYAAFRVGDSSKAAPRQVAAAPTVPAAHTPNVYWFVLDEYGRNDQLERLLNLDNEPFYDSLRAAGFAVSESSQVSYPRTHQSLSSTLEMAYLDSGVAGDEFDRLAPTVTGENATVDTFRAHGYDYVYSHQGWLEWARCDDSVAEVCLPHETQGLTLGELEQSLVDLTPVGPLGLFGLPFTDPVSVLDRLAEAEGEFSEPFFLFAHINAPHWPYRYTAGCSARSRVVDPHSVDLDGRKEGYEQDLECVNDLVLDAVEEIRERDPGAIIIVQSDHGPELYVDWDVPPDEWNSTALTSRYAALQAMYFPEECQHLDDQVEGLPTVNTFRLVFACIEGREPELLAHRAFLAPWDRFKDVQELDPARFDE